MMAEFVWLEIGTSHYTLSNVDIHSTLQNMVPVQCAQPVNVER